jgi:hypothetical protein
MPLPQPVRSPELEISAAVYNTPVTKLFSKTTIMARLKQFLTKNFQCLVLEVFRASSSDK